MTEASAAEARVIRGGTVVDTDGSRTADILIRGERIAEVGSIPDLDLPEIDARGCLVLPGAVDAHVHLETSVEGGFADDFQSGTRAALAGGVTTVGQMSLSDGSLLRPAVEHDQRIARRLACTDWLLHPGAVTLSDEAIAELPGLAADGCSTLKLVTLGIDDEPRAFLSAMAQAAQLGMVVFVHCEDGPMIDFATRRLNESGRTGLDAYPASRPVASESAAVERAIAMAELTGADLYLVHVSSAPALDAARRARARGQRVWVETRPVYLYLADDVYAGPQPGRYAGRPPLRRQHDVDALWRGIADGVIDTVATDHAPYLLAQKTDPALTVETVPKGLAELDTFLPLLYSEGVRTGRISIEQLVAVTSANPARILGIEHAKGSLRVGADADIVVFDPTEERTITARGLQTRADYSVYEGRRVTGWPRHVLSRGETVVSDGRVIAEPGRGRRVEPAERLPP